MTSSMKDFKQLLKTFLLGVGW